ncbi:hypothetical protein [Flavobacterium sp. JAS]|uniref:hypothetical protein n=1 Tax=Flavobacterium sp. JAS TaxID=2897329 RepID=UPI001E329584|nr:hypothetical protein [Flavobacterium sp. JAS]MCD0471838.1 hypothetical protein [Flavobacterium sp. JAS]
MKNTFFRAYMKLIVFLLLAATQTVNAQLYGDFPYNQSFTSGTQPSEVILPTGAGTNAAVFTTTGLELTPAVNSKFGAIIINNKKFNSSVGIKIAFEYAIYGGTGADGISVFLFDAAVTPVIGANGRGMGYSYLRANNTYSTFRKEGLSGAYLGIALDAYGNFKSDPFQGDARVNGVASPSGGWANSGSSHVTLRGARGGFLDANGKAAGFSGYPVLKTQSTLTTSATAYGGATITALGGYTYNNGIADNFNLRSGSYTADPNNIAYRKAFIELTPNALGGYNVTVKIQHQNIVTTVIDKYWYQPSVVYTENSNPAVTDFNTSVSEGGQTIHTLSTAIPESFKIGFGASTGGLNDVHKIWGLQVALPYAAEAVQDNAIICKNNTIDINPYANDVAYSGPTYGTPTASSSNIDFSQFRFLNSDGTTASNPFLVTNSQGTFSYNSTSGLVTFKPALGFIGKAEISYNIKGKTYPSGTFQPYGDEAYRSGIAIISVDVKKCQVITNPMMPAKINIKY